ncbi:MAG: tetratricopeptide repeat protein [Bacteroidales bacterium]|jgi:tetratricopeptide (TPR) repeat protein
MNNHIKLLINIICFTFFSISLFSQDIFVDKNKADEFYKNGDIAEALYIYQNIKLSNNSTENDGKIAEIQNIFKLDKDKANELFQQCIIKGNTALKANNFEIAYIHFKASLLIRPEANFPKSKLQELSAHIKDPMVEKQFELKKKEADDLFNAGNYDKADEVYSEALVLKQGDKYILDQKLKIQEINIQMAETKKLFNATLEQGDILFKQKNYEEAIATYNEAAKLLPGSDIPSEKIAEVNAVLQEIANLEERYQNLITQGDEAYENEDYILAQELFNESLTIKENADYPKNRLAAIEDILTKKNAKENEIQSIRDNILIAIQAEHFNMALSHIQTGLRLLPNDPEFTRQKSYIDSIITERKLAEMNYSNFVTRADEFYELGDYEQALRYYNRANELSKTSSLQNKIIQTEGMIAKEKAKEEAKSAEIIEDESSTHDFSENTNSTSTLENPEKSGNKPSKKEKIVVSDEDKLNYEYAIKRADLKFSRSELEAARKEYLDAQKFDPNKSYPQKMITQIDTILAQLNREKQAAIEAEQKAYNDYLERVKEEMTKPPDLDKTLAEGKNFYNSGEYDKALEKFEITLKANPSNKEATEYRNLILDAFELNIARVVVGSPISLNSVKQKFNFKTLSIEERKNAYLAIIIGTNAESTPKVYLNFYENNVRKGGMVIKELDENLSHKPVYFKLSNIMTWKRDDINTIEVFSENGDSNLIRMEIISM